MRTRSVVFFVRRTIGFIQKEGYAAIYDNEVVSLWIFVFLLCDVFPDALEYMAGIQRSPELETDGHSSVDVQASVALGI